MTSDVLWAEVWSSDTGYLAVVRALKNGTFELYDPKEDRVDGTYDTYEEAQDELRLDDFERVEGRPSEDADAAQASSCCVMGAPFVTYR